MGVCDHFTHVAVGAGYGCASRQSGVLVCWGNNDFGQLGNGTTVSATTPVVAARLTGVNALAAGRFALTSPGFPLEPGCPASCVQNANSLQCWGCNASAQTGIGVASGSVLAPSPVLNFPAFDSGGWALDTVEPQLSVGAGHACGWQMNPNAFPVLFCWGRNNYGQVNPAGASTTPVTTPMTIQVSTNHDSYSVAAGGRHTCVATTTPMRGFMSCWGDNSYGQRGPSAPGTNGIALVPVPAGEAIGDWVEAVAGDLFTCGRLATTHHVACWGLNDYNQLGDGSTVGTRSAPGIVPGINNAAQLAAATHAACVRTTAGGVECWGDGFGTTPRTIPGITDAVEIAMGDGTACAVRATGTVVCWSGVTTPTRLAGTGNW
jgi:alpha-tubulin suppressor-like RCC1 family protein